MAPTCRTTPTRSAIGCVKCSTPRDNEDQSRIHASFFRRVTVGPNKLERRCCTEPSRLPHGVSNDRSERDRGGPRSRRTRAWPGCCAFAGRVVEQWPVKARAGHDTTADFQWERQHELRQVRHEFTKLHTQPEKLRCLQIARGCHRRSCQKRLPLATNGSWHVCRFHLPPSKSGSPWFTPSGLSPLVYPPPKKWVSSLPVWFAPLKKWVSGLPALKKWVSGLPVLYPWFTPLVYLVYPAGLLLFIYFRFHLPALPPPSGLPPCIRVAQLQDIGKRRRQVPWLPEPDPILPAPCAVHGRRVQAGDALCPVSRPAKASSRDGSCTFTGQPCIREFFSDIMRKIADH